MFDEDNQRVKFLRGCKYEPRVVDKKGDVTLISRVNENGSAAIEKRIIDQIALLERRRAITPLSKKQDVIITLDFKTK